jgi:hypothetical protein
MQYDRATQQRGQKAPPPGVKPGSSDPSMKARMDHLNFRKAVKGARTSGQKAKIIESSLEKFF